MTVETVTTAADLGRRTPRKRLSAARSGPVALVIVRLLQREGARKSAGKFSSSI